MPDSNGILEAPIMAVSSDGETCIAHVDCPHCGDTHDHDMGLSFEENRNYLGVRPAHCGDGKSPYFNSMYRITDPDNLIVE